MGDLYSCQKYRMPMRRRDFLTAYPNFAKWAQSGGVSNTDWYTECARETEIRKIWYG